MLSIEKVLAQKNTFGGALPVMSYRPIVHIVFVGVKNSQLTLVMTLKNFTANHSYVKVSINGGTQKWMVYKGKSHLAMPDN